MKENNALKPKSKVRKIFEIIFVIFSSIISVASIAISCTIIFHNTYYELFWVNGQSMYPTLNYNAVDKNGNKIGILDTFGPIGNSNVDYGYMDVVPSVKENLQRFDIVVIERNPDSEIDIIKRILVLPNEQFYFVSTGRGNEHNGDLYVKKVGSEEFELIPQDFYDTSHPEAEGIVIDGEYNEGNPRFYSTSTEAPENPYQLADDEYFVAGDNRHPKCSSDDRQRQTGTFRNEIKGKAIGLEGTCSVAQGTNGKKYRAVDVKRYWPTRF